MPSSSVIVVYAISSQPVRQPAGACLPLLPTQGYRSIIASLLPLLYTPSSPPPSRLARLSGPPSGAESPPLSPLRHDYAAIRQHLAITTAATAAAPMAGPLSL